MDCGSSVKFCRIAEGKADVYPRLGRTSEWDIAAGDAVLTAAGGIVLSLDGTPVRYGQVARDLKVPSFVAWCDPHGRGKVRLITARASGSDAASSHPPAAPYARDRR